MNPPAITLDESTAAKLTAANGHAVPLCTPSGEVFGYYISPARREKMEEEHKAIVAELEQSWSPEEIRRLEAARKLDPRPNIPHEEVLRWVEEQ